MTPNDAPEVSGWVWHASQALSDAGYRRGGARAAVLDVLAAQACGRSAPEIEEAVRTDGQRRVSRASVYRILEELEALRLVTRLELGQDQARYEIARPDGHHHHHMVCTRCGEVIPFEDDDLEASIARLARRTPFQVDEHDIVLRGRCARCGPERQTSVAPQPSPAT